jgi:hypothetical protein
MFSPSIENALPYHIAMYLLKQQNLLLEIFLILMIFTICDWAALLVTIYAILVVRSRAFCYAAQHPIVTKGKKWFAVTSLR